MKVLIVEDEIHIARHLVKTVSSLLKVASIETRFSMRDAMTYLENNKIDLLFLDLNLRGKDGFEILESLVAQPFHVIIVSAHADKAIKAFEYGVLDFVPKPFTLNRLQKAINRIKNNDVAPEIPTRYFLIKKLHNLIRINEEEVLYFEAYGHYSKMHLKDGKVELYDKALVTLEPLLNEDYERVHKSYIVKMTQINSLSLRSGGKYALTISNNDVVPVGRTYYKKLREKWL